MKTSLAVAFCLTALAIGACEDARTSAPPTVVALARPSADAPAATVELAAGVALEVAHRLVQRSDVIVREVLAPTVQAGTSFADTSDRLGAEFVIWVDVTGTVEAPVVGYSVETSEGQVRAEQWEAEGMQGVAAAPDRIGAAALSALGGDEAATSSTTWPMSAEAPEYVQFLQALGKAHTAGAEEAERVAWYEAVAPALADYPPAVVELGHAYLDLAGTLPGTGPYYDLAEETLRRGFQLDPHYPPARYLLASCLTKLGRSEEAATLLQEGLVSHPDYAPYHDQLGYVSRYAGLMEASMGSYRRAQELDASLENLVATQDQITKSLIYLGDYDGALSSHERMEGFLARIGRAPDEKEWFYKGVIHLYAGETERALDAFRRGEETNPSTIWTTFGRGYAGIARGDRAAVAEVLDALEKSVVVDGERHYRLVHFASYLGEPERALEHLDVTIKSGFFGAPYFLSDPLTAALREHAGFTDVLTAAQERHDHFRGIVGGP